MAMKCCTTLETAKERCPFVFQGHPSNFKVTRYKTSPILTQIGRFRTIGRSQLSNPSDLPCYYFLTSLKLPWFIALNMISPKDKRSSRKSERNIYLPLFSPCIGRLSPPSTIPIYFCCAWQQPPVCFPYIHNSFTSMWKCRPGGHYWHYWASTLSCSAFILAIIPAFHKI